MMNSSSLIYRPTFNSRSWFITIAVLTLATKLPTGFAQSTLSGMDDPTDSSKARVLFVENQCIPKGGLGIITRDAYIVLGSSRNELLLADDKKWEGTDSKQNQVVFIIKNKVFEEGSLPVDFDISKSLLISFEGRKVAFFDFNSFSGGFYLRFKASTGDK